VRNGRKSCRGATKEKDERANERKRKKEGEREGERGRATIEKCCGERRDERRGGCNSAVTDKISRKCAKHISRFPDLLTSGPMRAGIEAAR